MYSYILHILGESCTLGEFPYESVSLAEDTFVTYTGCESSNGETINNYLLHLVISRGTHNIKVRSFSTFSLHLYYNHNCICI